MQPCGLHLTCFFHSFVLLHLLQLSFFPCHVRTMYPNLLSSVFPLSCPLSTFLSINNHFSVGRQGVHVLFIGILQRLVFQETLAFFRSLSVYASLGSEYTLNLPGLKIYVHSITPFTERITFLQHSGLSLFSSQRSQVPKTSQIKDCLQSCHYYQKHFQLLTLMC